MSDLGLHQIRDDLCPTWLEDWVGVGVAELGAYLEKHAAFLAFLDHREADLPRTGSDARPAR